MGLYMYITSYDKNRMRWVTDKELNDDLQEALKFDKSIMISEHTEVRKRLFRKPVSKTFYFVYHEIFLKEGRTSYEARQQMSASGSKEIVTAYLHGIVNGANSNTTPDATKS